VFFDTLGGTNLCEEPYPENGLGLFEDHHGMWEENL
jgi:hypothetical protein